MTNELDTIKADSQLALIGQEANRIAAQNSFVEYRARKAQNTIKRQSSELALFAQFVGVDFDLSTNPQGWQSITWGLVDMYTKAMLKDGYSLGTVNIHLSTIKRYSRLALKAGTLSREEFTRIMVIEPYSHKEKTNIDTKRKEAGIPVRLTSKKAVFEVVDTDTITKIKTQCDISPQGTRDTILLTLLFDFGLRVSEIAELHTKDFDCVTGKLRVYRPKTDIETVFTLTGAKLDLFKRYVEDNKPGEYFLAGSHKTGILTGRMSVRSIQNRFTQLCDNVGVTGLSCHDCRHTAATLKAKELSTRQMMAFFGWSSEKQAIHYQKPQQENFVD